MRPRHPAGQRHGNRTPRPPGHITASRPTARPARPPASAASPGATSAHAHDLHMSPLHGLRGRLPACPQHARAAPTLAELICLISRASGTTPDVFSDGLGSTAHRAVLAIAAEAA